MTAEVSQFKCPNCGAAIPFDANAQTLKCQYCDTEFPLETLQTMSVESNIQTDAYDWDEYDTQEVNDIDGQKTYTCPSCGGAVVGDDTMSAAQCPYCGNSIIVSNNFKGMYKPDLVIPFKYSRDDAKKAYSNYLKGKRLLAKDFEANNVIEKLNGLYVPYWLFDADCSCQARYDTTRVRRFINRDEEITEIDHYLVYRDGTISFEKVPVDASSKLDPALMESLEPYDYSAAVDFNTAYLSGYFADQYDESAEKAIVRANQRIKTSTEDAIDATVMGYQSVLKRSGNVRIGNNRISYALLPIYIFSTNYNGQVYNFAMNGQTGKFSGNLPADQKLSSGYAALIFAISFIVLALVMIFLVK